MSENRAAETCRCGHPRAYHRIEKATRTLPAFTDWECAYPIDATGAPCQCHGFVKKHDSAEIGPQHHDRLVSDLESGNVTDLGIGAVSLNVGMAREHGWSNPQIAATFEAIGALVRQNHRDVAFQRGYRYVCPVCECWTDAPPKPCHLCTADTPTS